MANTRKLNESGENVAYFCEWHQKQKTSRNSLLRGAQDGNWKTAGSQEGLKNRLFPGTGLESKQLMERYKKENAHADLTTARGQCMAETPAMPCTLYVHAPTHCQSVTSDSPPRTYPAIPLQNAKVLENRGFPGTAL